MEGGTDEQVKGDTGKNNKENCMFLSLRTNDGHKISSPLLNLMDRVKYDHQVDQTNTEVDFKVNNEISIKQ